MIKVIFLLSRLLRIMKMCIVGGLLTLTFALSVTYAQEYALEEIVVTAEKREQNSQSVGISMSTFSEANLESLGTRSVLELSRFVPNLQIGSETSDLKVMLRGVGSDNLEAFGDPGVAIHIDGVYQARPSGGNSLFHDMERVEVLRGPQGTLYGRNATGGAINFITRKPTDEFDAALDIGVGDEGWKRARGMINTPLGETLMFRASGVVEERDGVQQNLISGGTKGNNIDDTSVRAHLTWLASDNATIMLSAHSLDKGGVGPVRKRVSAPGSTVISPSGVPANCQDCGYVINPADLRTVFKDTAESFDLKTDGYSINLDYDFGSMVLTAIGSDQSTDMDLLVDSDQNPMSKGRRGGTTDTAQVAQRSDQQTLEVRLASDSDGPWEWLAGVYYLDENAFQNTEINRNPTFGASANIDVLHDVNSTSKAAFGQLSFSPSDNLKLTAGARYSKDEKDAVGGTIVTIDPPNPFIPFPPPGRTIVTPPIVRGSHGFTPEGDWSKTTWKLGLDWTVSDDSLLYATVSTGYKAGGFNFGVASAEIYDPEELTAFEVGSKNRFMENRVQLNMATFYYDYTDLQVFQVVDRTIVVRNAAEARIYGAEVELVAMVSEALQIDASLGLLNTEYENFVLPSNLFLGATGDPTNVDVSGNNLVNAPETSSHVGAQYTFNLQNYGNLTARIQGSWTDDVYLRPLNLKTFDVQESYAIWDAKLMWESESGSWWAEAFYNNLGDEDVISNLEVTDSGIYFANTNAPKLWGVTVGFRY